YGAPNARQRSATSLHASSACSPRARASSAAAVAALSAASGGPWPRGKASGRTSRRARSTRVSAQSIAAAAALPGAAGATAASGDREVGGGTAARVEHGGEVEGVVVVGIEVGDEPLDDRARLSGVPAPQRELGRCPGHRAGPHRADHVALGAHGLGEALGGLV